MRALVVVALLVVLASPARAEPRWTLAPTFGGGMAWTDGHRDYVGDPPYCHSMRGTFAAFTCSPLHTARPFERSIAPAFSAGVLATYDIAPRWAWTGSATLVAASTHRFVYETPNERSFGFEDADGIHVYSPDVRVGFRVGSTARFRAGSHRRGFVGAGANVGFAVDVARREDFVIPTGIDPDASLGSGRQSRIRFRHGLTAEALLEGGVLLGAQRGVSLSLVVAAGRPLVRSELVLAFPFSVGR